MPELFSALPVSAKEFLDFIILLHANLSCIHAYVCIALSIHS